MAKLIDTNGLAQVWSKAKETFVKKGEIDSTLFKVVTELPTTNIDTTKIYIVPAGTTGTNNAYKEYIYLTENNQWEILGELKADFALQITNNTGSTALSWNTATTVATINGTDIKVKLPANPNSDTKVTSAANHYAPAEDTNSVIDAAGATAQSIVGASNAVQVVTGVKRDAKGHVVGVKSKSLYAIDTHHQSCSMMTSDATSTITAANRDNVGYAYLNHIEDGNVRSSIKIETDGIISLSKTSDGIKFSTNGSAVASTSAAGLMSADDKAKLDGIAAQANKYTLPTATSSTLGGVKVTTGNGLSISSGVVSMAVATTSAAGAMSQADKTKLDGIAEGANNYTLPAATASALGGVKVTAGHGLSNNNGTISMAAATSTASGAMSAGDKDKLDNLQVASIAEILAVLV